MDEGQGLDVTICALGKRDAYAEVLAESMSNGVRITCLAVFYRELTGEKHFSHAFHTEAWKQ